MNPRNSQNSLYPTPMRASTQTVVPAYILSARESGESKGHNEVPLSPEVHAHTQGELDAFLEGLSEAAINRSSLSPHEQALAEFLGEAAATETIFNKFEAEQYPIASEVQSKVPASPEAEVVATIEQQTNEGLYEAVARNTEAISRGLRPSGLAYPEGVLRRIQEDYELAA